MKWSEGHVWRVSIDQKELGSEFFEYKFVVKQGAELVRWEEGFNHIFDNKKFVEMLKQPNIVKEIENSK